MADHSFDVVSDYDVQELKNALEQSRREITTRYDFKGSPVSIDYTEKEGELVIVAESAQKLTAVFDIIMAKMVKRDVPLKVLDMTKTPESALSGQIRQHVPLKKGLKQEDAKKITKLIREQHPKVKASIQGDSIRVVDKDLDILQSVQQLLRDSEFDMPLQFTNYR